MLWSLAEDSAAVYWTLVLSQNLPTRICLPPLAAQPASSVAKQAGVATGKLPGRLFQDMFRAETIDDGDRDGSTVTLSLSDFTVGNDL